MYNERTEHFILASCILTLVKLKKKCFQDAHATLLLLVSALFAYNSVSYGTLYTMLGCFNPNVGLKNVI